MENPCKIVFFGDSITKVITPVFEEKLRSEYPEVALDIVNAGVSGETSKDGLARLDALAGQTPQVVVIGFGMNDWRKGVSAKEFEKNLLKMVEEFENIGARVILTTINPAIEGGAKAANSIIDKYNSAIKAVARCRKLKIADVNSLWKKEFRNIRKGLRDKIHPNRKGYEVFCKALMRVVPRRNTVVLWQYNGREAKCNYKCPYCYYSWAPKQTDYFFGTAQQWHDAFKNAFGRQHLVFYLAFGEPMIGAAFYDVVEMIGAEPDWELRITSNLSVPLDRLVETKVAKEGRLNINGSFHPLATSPEKFLEQLLFLRKHGIEIPVVYVMYPPFLERFEKDFKIFDKHNFLVHVRRFRGDYKGKFYPESYTDEEKRFIARYCDDATIKYMLNEQDIRGELSYSGMHFVVVDCTGNVGYDSDIFRPYTKYRCILGNVLQENFIQCLEPIEYPEHREGTVDGVANLLKLGYHELEGNNVMSFARQGGVYHTENGVHYKNLNTDFTDSRVRAEYNFPPRGLKDEFFVFLQKRREYWRGASKRGVNTIKRLISKVPFLKMIIKKILGIFFPKRFGL